MEEQLLKWYEELERTDPPEDRPRQNVFTPNHNKVSDRYKLGVRPEAKHARTPLEALGLFLSNDFLEKIVDYTNICIEKIRINFARDRDALCTNKLEIKAILCLLYLAGVAKSSHVNICDLWATDDRKERKLEDRLSPVRDMFEEFVHTCQNMYTVSENVTIDEVLESFQIYAGKQPQGPYYLDNSAFEVVKRLVFPISGTGRNVTMDNWFTTVPLSEELIKNHNLTMVDTIRKNKREIPVEFYSKRKKSTIPYNMFGFKEGTTLVSHTSQKGKLVLLLSTMHHDDAIDHTTKEKKKPEIITYYNKTKGAVDVVDEMKGINAQVICEENVGKKMVRRTFLKELGLSLCKEYMDIERRFLRCQENYFKK
ncbi:hypothetical protein NQ314_003241 [Rhamnusium bicolor]|uniref:PiggyBac transposable element-derived protein domain-containing protein n=1 Tax=Rhamnusium bicolor TaxID=1586634 RepID=A0AAV8ZQA4_9CUCU|nr:hypothetical protein NQ314_003241 [Rhamnusium bicolor]